MNRDASPPCHSKHSQTGLSRISFILIFCSFIIPFEGSLGLASDAAPQKSENRSEDIVEHFVSGFPDVYFDSDSKKLNQKAMEDLERLIHYLKTHPNSRINLEGNVDDHYSNAYGLDLSYKQAEIVKRYLLEHGVTNAIKTTGYGRERPFCLQRTKACRRENNRVHVLVSEYRKISEPASSASHGSAPQATEPAPPFVLPTVYFQRNSFQLDKKARASLTPLVDHLKTHPDVQIRLIGRVDERHTTAYGLDLSSKRAEAVKKFLREQGVENAITIQGVGKEEPVCFEHNEDCYRMSNQVRVMEGH